MAYNMNETKTGFDPIPSDRYTFVVDSASAEEYTKVDKDGNSQNGHHIEIALHIADGPFAKRKVWDHIYLPGALWRARQVLQAAGKTAEATSSSIEADGIAGALVGTTFSAWVETTKGNNGSPRYDLKDYTSVNGTEENPAADFDRILDRTA